MSDRRCKQCRGESLEDGDAFDLAGAAEHAPASAALYRRRLGSAGDADRAAVLQVERSLARARRSAGEDIRPLEHGKLQLVQLRESAEALRHQERAHALRQAARLRQCVHGRSVAAAARGAPVGQVDAAAAINHPATASASTVRVAAAAATSATNETAAGMALGHPTLMLAAINFAGGCSHPIEESSRAQRARRAELHTEVLGAVHQPLPLVVPATASAEAHAALRAAEASRVQLAPLVHDEFGTGLDRLGALRALGSKEAPVAGRTVRNIALAHVLAVENAAARAGALEALRVQLSTSE